MLLEHERHSVVEYGKKLITNRLVAGTGGNISLMDEDRELVAISPSGLDYFETTVEDITVVDLDGHIIDGKMRPSSELFFHLALYNKRPDIRSVVHTHSMYATTIACLGWELPAVHYLIAQAGESVPCAPFAAPGTQALADHICNTIGEGNAVLMANHGSLAVGPTLPRAYALAEKLEYVAQLYFQAMSIGTPQILDSMQMADVLRQAATYGQPQKITQ